MCRQLCWSIFAMINFPNQFSIAENIYVRIISLHVANKQVYKFSSFLQNLKLGATISRYSLCTWCMYYIIVSYKNKNYEMIVTQKV